MVPSGLLARGLGLAIGHLLHRFIIRANHCLSGFHREK